MATTTRSSPRRITVDASPDACCSSVKATLSQSEADALAQRFAALADPVRLRLFSMIASTDEVCACNLTEPLGKSQPTVSHHTKVLAEAGLIVGEKRGRWVWWSAVAHATDDLRTALK